MAYFKCSNCYQVEPESDWLQDSKSIKCKHCSNLAEYELWPSTEVRELLGTIREYNQDSSEYGLVVSVFVCTALELLLERLLFTMALLDREFEESEFLIDLLLDTNQGRARRLQLYKRLGDGSSFKSESEHVGFPQFLARWDELAEIRNRSVHGELKEGRKVTFQFAEVVLSEALAVFSKLHNKYNQYSISYQVALEPSNEFEKNRGKDLEKLKRWKEQVIDPKSDDSEE